MKSKKGSLLEQLADEQSTRANLTEHVAERLSGFIASSGMEPGEPLPSEDDLSTAFGVSKRVVREALRTLSARGIVKTSQGKRAVVAHSESVAMAAYFKYAQQLDRSAMLELYELREVVEVQATVLAAKRIQPEELARAHAALQTMERAGDDQGAYIEGDLAFHRALIDGAHNRFLSAIVDALAGALYEERKTGVVNRVRSGDGPRAINEHRAILDALENADAVDAEQRIIAHLASGLVDFRPDRFADGAKPERVPKASSKSGTAVIKQRTK
jgi:GntR family transcriptional repressor for pyruvate dehydrogenase complex